MPDAALVIYFFLFNNPPPYYFVILELLHSYAGANDAARALASRWSTLTRLVKGCESPRVRVALLKTSFRIVAASLASSRVAPS